MKMTFQPKKRQRSREQGFRKRMRTANGRKVLLQEEEKAEKYYPRKKAQSYAFSRHFFITKTYTKAADCGLLFV